MLKIPLLLQFTIRCANVLEKADRRLEHQFLAQGAGYLRFVRIIQNLLAVQALNGRVSLVRSYLLHDQLPLAAYRCHGIWKGRDKTVKAGVAVIEPEDREAVAYIEVFRLP